MTIREALEAEVASLEKKLADGTERLTTAIAAEKAKLEGLHPTLLAVLAHPIDDVRAFFRSFGVHLFGQTPATPAEAIPSAPGPIETKVYSDGTSVTGPGPLPTLSPAQQDAETAANAAALAATAVA